MSEDLTYTDMSLSGSGLQEKLLCGYTVTLNGLFSNILFDVLSTYRMKCLTNVGIFGSKRRM